MYFQGLLRKGLLLFPFFSLLLKQFMLSKNNASYLKSGKIYGFLPTGELSPYEYFT